jgi:glycosyltransferase involved in cell wall biosynthesis
MSQTLRVLLSFPTRLGTPGIGTTAWNQAAGLARLGADVSVWCGSLERPLPGVRRVVETMRIGRWKVPYRAVGQDRAIRYHDRRVARLIRHRPEQFDVVHSWPGGGEQTLDAARRLGVTAVLERPNTHTAFAFAAVADECRRIGVPVDPSSPHATDPARLRLEEREFAAADALLCPSDFVAETHADRGIPRERLVRHQYGYDPNRFPLGDQRDGRPFTAVFVGRVEPRKGLHLALQAWSEGQLGQVGTFLICGSIDPGYGAVLEPLLADPSVTHLGHVPDPGLVMRDADVLVLPSMEEGSALVTYEARGSGCVLVVSDRTGAVCRHEYDGLVHTAGDVSTLKDHLAALAVDPQLLARLRAASLHGIGDLTWDAAAASLFSAYETAMRLSAT